MSTPCNHTGGKSPGGVKVAYDPDALMALVANDSTLAQTVIETFIEQADQILESLGNVDSGRERTQLVALLHRLNGSASSIGAREFAALCRHWEIHLARQTEGQHGLAPLDSEVLDEIRSSYQGLRQELVRYLK